MRKGTIYLARLFVLRTWTPRRPLDDLVTFSAGQTMSSTANRELLTTSEAGFGSFVYFCRDVPSYTWCNLFYKQVSSVYLTISYSMLINSVIILTSCP